MADYYLEPVEENKGYYLEPVESLKKSSGAERSFSPTLADKAIGYMGYIGEQLLAPIETGVSLLAGLGAFPVARAGKLLELARGKSEEEAKITEENISRFLSSNPSTDTAQELLNTIGTGLNFIAQTGREAVMMPAESWKLKGFTKELALTAGELAAFAVAGKGVKTVKNILKPKEKIISPVDTAEYKLEPIIKEDNLIEPIPKTEIPKTISGEGYVLEPITAKPYSPLNDITTLFDEEPIPTPLKGAGEVKQPWEMTKEELRNWDINVPKGGGSKSPKAVFSWDKSTYETLYDLSQQADKFRFDESLGKGWNDWKPSLYLREKIRRNEPITIYRASEEGDIIPGAYVSESFEYVKGHQENIMQGAGQIYSRKVKPSELMIYGDPHEFIYIPESVEFYQKPLIQQALSEGKPVPPEVLKDYPDLVKAEVEPLAKEDFGSISKTSNGQFTAYDTVRKERLYVKGKGTTIRYFDTEEAAQNALNKVYKEKYSQPTETPLGKAGKPPEPLGEEARKYGNAEEFVNNQKTYRTVYHGSGKEIKEFDINKPANVSVFGIPHSELGISAKPRGYIFVTEKIKDAKIYGNPQKIYLQKDTKIFNPGKASEAERRKILGEDNWFRVEESGGVSFDLIDLDANPTEGMQIANNLKKYGYDGIYVDEGEQGYSVARSIALLNPDKVKTRQQLTDFYNQAKAEGVKGGGRTVSDVVSDVKTALGDIGKAKGLSIKDVSPEEVARLAERERMKAEARGRLFEDAKRQGKAIDKYLAEQGVSPENIAKFMATVPKEKASKPEAGTKLKEVYETIGKEYEVAKLAKRTELESIKTGLVEDGFTDIELRKYEAKPGMLDKEVGLFQTIMDKDWDTAVDMALGKIKTPRDIHEAIAYKAVEERAVLNNDIDTLMRLSSESTIPESLSKAGQEIVAARTGLRKSPLSAAKEVEKVRAETSRRTGKRPLSNARLEKVSKKIEITEEALINHEVSKAVRKARLDVAKEQRQVKRTYAKTELDVEFTGLAKQLSSHLSGQLNVGLDPMTVKFLTQMTLNRIKKGVVKAEEIIDSIYTEIRKAGVDLSKREIQDAVSQYGKPVYMSKEELKVKLREAKRNMRLISALEDATQGEAPLKSGLQRDIQSEEVRLRTKAVKDMMRRKGIITAKTPEEQWKASLDSYKTRLTNEIADMEKNIAEGILVKKEKTAMVLDSTTQALKAKRDVLKRIYNIGIEASGKVTREELTNLVEMYNISEKLKVNMEQGGNRIEYGASKRAYENYIEELKGSNDPLIQKLKERGGEFKTTFSENPEKAVYDVVKDTLQTITDNSIAVVASLDESFLGRQGLTTLLNDVRNKILFRGRESVWLPAAKNAFVDFAKTIGGKNMHDALMADIYSRPNYLNGEYINAKILNLVEEQFPTTLPERIPLGVGRVFRGAEYAFTGSALRMRTGLYDMFSTMAKEKGKPWGKAEQADMGKVINSMTARGQWGKRGENALIRLVMWAPKMLKADWDILTMHTFRSGLDTSFAKNQAALNLVTAIAEVAIIQAISNAFWPKSAETDPRSSNWGKVRMKNTGYATDLLGIISEGLGISSNRVGRYRTFSYVSSKGAIINLASRLITGETKNAETGEITEYGKKYGAKNTFDALIDFFVNKMPPAARTVVDKLRGRFFDYTPFTWGKAAQRIVTPITIQNIIEMDKRKKIPKNQ